MSRVILYKKRETHLVHVCENGVHQIACAVNNQPWMVLVVLNIEKASQLFAAIPEISEVHIQCNSSWSIRITLPRRVIGGPITVLLCYDNTIRHSFEMTHDEYMKMRKHFEVLLL